MGGENGIESGNGTNTAGNNPAETVNAPEGVNPPEAVDVPTAVDQRRDLQGQTAAIQPAEENPDANKGQTPSTQAGAPASAPATGTQTEAPTQQQAPSTQTETPHPTPEAAAQATADAISGGNPQVASTLINVYENTPATLPTGDARYMYIAKGLEKFMEENPDSKKSTFVQMGYALCLFFGKLGGFSANPDTYSAMVSSIYNDEKMSVDDIQKYLDAKSKGPYAKTLMQDAYLKCKEELAKENKKTKKDEDLIKYFTIKLEKIKERLVKIFEMDEAAINAINREQVETELVKMMIDASGKNKYTQDLVEKNKTADKDKKDQVIEGILNSDKVDLIDSMLSVEYVKRALDLPEIKGNDVERLYARFFNSRYHLKGAEDKPKLPYFHLKDYTNFIQRAKEKTLAVNTIVFFSPIVDGKSVVMTAVVCPDHKIRYQARDGLHEIDPTNDTAELHKLFNGIFFKGAFEPEESEFNIDISNQIEAENKAKLEAEAGTAAAETAEETTTESANGEPKPADAAAKPADAQPKPSDAQPSPANPQPNPTTPPIQATPTPKATPPAQVTPNPDASTK